MRHQARLNSPSLLKLGHSFQSQFKSHFAAGTFPDWNGKNSLDKNSLDKTSKLNFLCWFKDHKCISELSG